RLWAGMTEMGESSGNAAKADAFRRNVLLAFDIRGPNNQREPLQGWVLQFVIFNNRFKTAAVAAMIELDLRNTRGIVGNGFVLLRRLEQLFLRDKEKLRFRVDKAANQPGTRHAINLHVFSRDPFHFAITLRSSK